MRTIVQSFVGVLFRKAGAQHILEFRMPEACYVLRPSGRVGRNGKLRITPLVSCTQSRVAVCLKKSLGPAKFLGFTCRKLATL